MSVTKSICCGLSLVLFVAALAPAPATGGISGELYVSQLPIVPQGGPPVGDINVLQGNSVVRSWQRMNYSAFAMAVSGGTVRVAPSPRIHADASGTSYEYTTDGALTGVTYTREETYYANPNFGYESYMLDGATNGVQNFGVPILLHNVRTKVYSWNSDWSNPQFLFDTAVSSLIRTDGITYDPTTDTMWVAGQSADRSAYLAHFAMDGTLLAEINVSQYVQSDLRWLAMDYTDGTLWTEDHTSDVFCQFDTSGNLLSTLAIPGIGTKNHMGGEFELISVIPTPAASLLAALGIITLATSRRR